MNIQSEWLRLIASIKYILAGITCLLVFKDAPYCYYETNTPFVCNNFLKSTNKFNIQWCFFMNHRLKAKNEVGEKSDNCSCSLNIKWRTVSQIKYWEILGINRIIKIIWKLHGRKLRERKWANCFVISDADILHKKRPTPRRCSGWPQRAMKNYLLDVWLRSFSISMTTSYP